MRELTASMTPIYELRPTSQARHLLVPALVRIVAVITGVILTLVVMSYVFSLVKQQCAMDSNGVVNSACRSHPGLPDPGVYGPEQYGNPDGAYWQTGRP